MNTELKLGHSVIAWDNDKSKAVKGKFAVHGKDDTNYPYLVLPDGNVEMNLFTNCELDPDATEFLSGDVVVVSVNNKDWLRAEYVGFYENLHYVILDGGDMVIGVTNCRYLKPVDMLSAEDFTFETDTFILNVKMK
jgi:hypothetical protein